MYLDGLDELDQKIIQLLIENARISYSDIGEKTGISRVAVKARIQALEKKGVIEEYTTIINPQKISGAVSVSYTHLSRLIRAPARDFSPTTNGTTARKAHRAKPKSTGSSPQEGIAGSSADETG